MSLEQYEYYRTPNGILYCGKNTEICPSLPSHDLLLTDPPYGINENADKIKSRGKLAKNIDYGKFYWDKEPASKDELSCGLSISKRAVVWGGNFFDLPPSSGWLVWDKLNGGSDFADAELAWTNLKMAVRIFKHRWMGMIRDSERDRKRVHPTQKPVALFIWCIGFAKEAQTVLDTFAGSCTTAIACERLGKKWTCIEEDERWCEAGKKRIIHERQQLKLF